MAYIGFKQLQAQLAHRPGVRNPGALTAAIGRRKYGDQQMEKAARTGHSLEGAAVGKQPRREPVRRPLPGTKLKSERSERDEKVALFARTASSRAGDGRTRITEDDPRWNPRTMGNHRGSKNTRQTPMYGQYRPT